MPYKTTDLTALAGSALAGSDLDFVTDVSDTTHAATGTTKKMTVAERLLGHWRLYPEKKPFTFDGGGAAISSGLVREWIVPWDCTILGWTGVADQSGSISIEVSNDTYANYSASVPGSGQKISASAPIILSSAIKNTDTTLTGWTTSLTGGSILRFTISSVATITRFHWVMHLRRTG